MTHEEFETYVADVRRRMKIPTVLRPVPIGIGNSVHGATGGSGVEVVEATTEIERALVFLYDLLFAIPGKSEFPTMTHETDPGSRCDLEDRVARLERELRDHLGISQR